MNISDFSCQCSGSMEYFCNSHIGIHFNHEQLLFWPNSKTLANANYLKEELNKKKENIKEMINSCNNMRNKCIDDINSISNNIITKLEQSIFEIEFSIEHCLQLQTESSHNFLGIHRFLFSENFEALNNLVDYQENYQNFYSACAKLFSVKSITENFFDSAQYFNIDSDYLQIIDDMYTTKNEYKILLKQMIPDDKNPLNSFTFIMKEPFSNLKTNFIALSYKYSANVLNSISLYGKFAKNVTSIYSYDQNYSNEQFVKIRDIFKSFEKINSLHFSNSINNEYQVKLFLESCDSLCYLDRLSISKNYIGGEAIQALLLKLASIKKAKKFLVFLNLSYNIITENHANSLLILKASSFKLSYLNLEGNELDISGAKALMEVLPQMRSLEILNISNNNIQCEGVQYIMKGLCFCSKINFLDICMNNIYDEGILTIAGYLNYFRCLYKLTIDLMIRPEVINILCNSVISKCKIIGKNENGRKVLRNR